MLGKLNMSLSSQLFFRFYLVIVISLVAVGWAIDAFWRHTVIQNQVEEPQFPSLAAAASLLNLSEETKHSQLLAEFNLSLSAGIKLVPFSSIHVKEIEHQLLSGLPVTLSDGKTETTYIMLNNKRSLLAQEQSANGYKQNIEYFWLALFYLLIALIVYFLIRPLTKDLKSLERAAINFSDRHFNTSISISKNSPVHQLAQVYNQLLKRIQQLITDQKEMTNAISHELRTPIARIKFSLEMAQSGIKSNKTPQAIETHLESINEDIQEIHQLVDELLALASFEKQAVNATLERGDLSSLVKSTIEKLTPLAGSLTIEYANHSQNSFAYCDSMLIERALQNLISNAMNYAKSTIKVEIDESPLDYSISVHDDGPGIASENFEQVFNSFVRLSSNSKIKGFGLGLAIVKRIMQLHNGKAVVAGSKLGGAHFTLRWPK
jgi:two-component system, OmpR family, sensor kinase